MKIKYKDFEGELIIAPQGYVTIGNDGNIGCPSLLYLGQNPKGDICCFGAIILDDEPDNVCILDDECLQRCITLYDIQKYLQFRKNNNAGLNEKELENYANNAVQMAEFRKVYVYDNVKEYVRNKEYLKLLKSEKQ